MYCKRLKDTPKWLSAQSQAVFWKFLRSSQTVCGLFLINAFQHTKKIVRGQSADSPGFRVFQNLQGTFVWTKSYRWRPPTVTYEGIGAPPQVLHDQTEGHLWKMLHQLRGHPHITPNQPKETSIFYCLHHLVFGWQQGPLQVHNLLKYFYKETNNTIHPDSFLLPTLPHYLQVVAKLQGVLKAQPGFSQPLLLQLGRHKCPCQ